MATRLILRIPGDEAGKSMTVDVRQTFDEVLDHLMPIQQPSSSLEYRETTIYTHAETGERVLIRPSSIEVVLENWVNG